MTTVPTKPAADLVRGDEIPPGFLPTGLAASVLLVEPYEMRGRRWVMVAYLDVRGLPAADFFYADTDIPVVASSGDTEGDPA